MTKTRLQYQTADKAYRDLEPLPDHPNVYCIPAQANTTGQIRVYASDLAGNLANRECNVSQLPTPAKIAQAPPATLPTPSLPPFVADPKLGALPAPDKITLPALPTIDQTPPPVKLTTPPTMPPAEKPVGPNLLPGNLNVSPGLGAASGTVPQGPPLQEVVPAKRGDATPQIKTISHEVTKEQTPSKIGNVAPQVVQVTPTVPAVAGPATVAPKQDGAPVHHLLVNSTHVFLEYRIEQAGPSGVGRVEIWCTRDKGQSWQKLGENPDRKSPAEVNLAGDGIYGLTLVVSNGLGFGAQPPVPGEAPDWWIEVDTTRPTAQITSVRLATEDGLAVHVAWTSQDRNLGNGPVELFYAASRQGPWVPMAKGLKGEGQFRWLPPLDIGPHAYVRLAVRDLAGNITVTETTNPVALDDLSRPRASIAGISTDSGVVPAPK
jgi:hypothetical protein